MKKIIMGLIVLTVSAFLILILSGCQDNYSRDREIGSVDRSSLNIVRKNEVTVGDIHWQLLKAELVGPIISNEFGASLESLEGRFIFIEFSVENVGEDIRQLLDLKVIDDKGRVYSICNEAYGYFAAPAACTLQDIFPETKQTFNASFDVPVDSVDLILEITDLKIPPQERVYIDLGL